METAATAGYSTNGGTRGGIVVAWNTEAVKAAGKDAVEHIAPGRAISARVTALACGATVRVVGVYAPCRGGAEDTEAGGISAETLWDKVEAHVSGDEEAKVRARA